MSQHELYLLLYLSQFSFLINNLVPSISNNFKIANYFELSYRGVVSAIPFVFFSFLYHPNIPIVYRELKVQNHSTMKEIIIFGSIFVVTVYILVSTFGYLGIVSKPEFIFILLTKSSSLEINYENWLFTVATIGFLFTIFASAPLSMLPAKDTVEYLVFPGQTMNFKENFIVTIVLCLI